MNRLDRPSSRLLTLGALLLCAWPLAACNVPVFRYALERWSPRPYEVVVFHKGPLAAKDKEAVQALERHASGEGCANLDVELVDLDREPDERAARLFATQENPVLPWMVVRAHDVEKKKITVWAGRLSADSVSGLVDSPLRREVGKHILAGETAVWVLLESGDRAKDDEAADRLQAELRRVTPLLKLPKLTDSPDDRLSARGPPLRIAFSVVRLKRDDPAERMLVSMFLTSEDDLPERKEPMAFPVFGRGHCMAGLIGRGLNAENVRKCCSVLLAPCTCDVQGDLPRFDLLTNFDWKEALEKPSERVPSAGRISNPSGREAETDWKSVLPEPPPTMADTSEKPGERVPLPQPKPRPAASTPAEVVDEETSPLISRRVLLFGVGLAALLVVLTGTWAVLSNRRGLDS
jgi:hypothetical protein